jgi:multicomponent Na+:H+ antiporter subunit E
MQLNSFSVKKIFVYWLPIIIWLAILWTILSGITEPLFIFYAAVSIFLSLLFAYRAGFANIPKQNGLRLLKLPIYLPWLLWQIIKSNIDVANRILQGNDAISPVLFELPIKLDTDHGRALFAQSVTLTPGTISLIIYNEKIIVHALSEEGKEGLLQGDFEKPALWYEGSLANKLQSQNTKNKDAPQ